MHGTNHCEWSVAMNFFGYPQQRRFVEHIEWNAGEVVIIDNWRVLHGRGEEMNAVAGRTLLRVIVR